MLSDSKTNDEEGRLLALKRLEVLDTPEEAPFEKIVGLVEQVLNVPMCAVSLVDRDRQWLKARRGLSSETPRAVSFCTHTIQQTLPFIVRDALDDPLFAQNVLVKGAPFIRSYAGIPLKTPDGYNIGSLCAIDVKPREFAEAEVAILERFAKIVIDELELRQVASSDHLTGALSRRAWMQRAQEEVARAQRYGRPLSLAMLDIDKFKSINDTYGHPAGDGVITSVAKNAMSTIRQSDIFGRLGGEEFGLLMPETTAESARSLAERLRSQVEGTTLDLGSPVNCTISIGIAEMTAQAAELEVLVQLADQALYKAKSGGRNRTIVAD
jgi:diguanylate cyclase (GGDEF)-like protein